MNFKKIFKNAALFSAIIASSLISACGGGGGVNPAPTPPEETITISGTAMKGNISGAKVTAYLIDNKAIVSSDPISVSPATTGIDGKFTLVIKKVTEPIVIKVEGGSSSTYKSEITGNDIPFSATESLNLLISDPSLLTKAVSASPFTQQAFDRYSQIGQTTTFTDAKTAIVDANSFVSTLNGISDVTAPADSAYNTALTIVEQILVSKRAADSRSNTTTLSAILKYAATTSTGYNSYKMLIEKAVTAIEEMQIKPAAYSKSDADAIKTAILENPTTDLIAISDAKDTIPPTKPANIAATVPNTGTSVALSWSASVPGAGSSNAVIGYEVYRGDSTDFSKAIFIAAPSTASYTDTTVAPDKTYYYWVRGVNANMVYSDYAPYKEVKTTSNLPLATPMSVSTSGSIQ